MNNYIPENIECFFSSDEEDEDSDEELVRITDRVVATSGIEKALSVSMDFESSSYEEYNPTHNLTYANSTVLHRNLTYYIIPEMITSKNGNKAIFGGKEVDYPQDFQKWNKNAQDNWKQAVRNEALRPFHISLLTNKQKKMIK